MLLNLYLNGIQGKLPENIATFEYADTTNTYSNLVNGLNFSRETYLAGHVIHIKVLKNEFYYKEYFYRATRAKTQKNKTYKL